VSMLCPAIHHPTWQAGCEDTDLALAAGDSEPNGELMGLWPEYALLNHVSIRRRCSRCQMCSPHIPLPTHLHTMLLTRCSWSLTAALAYLCSHVSHLLSPMHIGKNLPCAQGTLHASSSKDKSLVLCIQ
jgi:hypothetical protein